MFYLASCKPLGFVSRLRFEQMCILDCLLQQGDQSYTQPSVIHVELGKLLSQSHPNHHSAALKAQLSNLVCKHKQTGAPLPKLCSTMPISFSYFSLALHFFGNTFSVSTSTFPGHGKFITIIFKNMTIARSIY